MSRAKKSKRKKRATTKASLKAARKNGVKGGRPRDKLPQAIVDDIGKIPANEKEIRVWCSRVLGKVTELSMVGGISHELAADLRANVKAILAALPPAKTVNEDDDEDDDEGGSAGAELEEDEEEEFDGVRA